MGFSLKAIWKYKCPVCRNGDLFIKPMNLKKPLAMHERCQYCRQPFEPEPGFYFGAMFISYIISSFMFLIPGLFVVFYWGWTANQSMALIIFLGVIFYLPLLRGSRVLWLHLMVRHRKDKELLAREFIANEDVEKSKKWKPKN